MRISLETRINYDIMNTANGYGYATDRMVASLTRLGHQVKINDEEAPVAIWFDQPHHWKWRDHQYKIGYHPWESTRLKDDWADRMNLCDEIWTPSPLIAEWYKADGVSVPIYVYEHGVDEIWSPVHRTGDKIKFLHIGAEAARKGGYDALRAFRKAFPHKTDVEFTMKMVNAGWKIDKIGNVNIVNRKLTLDELVQLYADHNVYVYPSSGEGFGLTPLQAMATGMPTITVPDWAPYERFLDPSLNLKSRLKISHWQSVHPGMMFRIDKDDLVDKMRWAYDNYSESVTFAHAQTHKIAEDYNWDKLTQNAFEDLDARLKNL